MKRYIIQTAVAKKRLMPLQENQREVRKPLKRLIEEMNIIHKKIKKLQGS